MNQIRMVYLRGKCSSIYLVKFIDNCIASETRVFFLMISTFQSLFTLRRQWYNFHYFGVVNVDVTNRYYGTKWRCLHSNSIFQDPKLPLPPQCEQGVDGKNSKQFVYAFWEIMMNFSIETSRVFSNMTSQGRPVL